ncbi:hypothetical protein BpHYR1_054452 [Brachionus plicatilis]|uniref:Uncharacterized protein n=1 Tax=Brachionus plicatilis TaxID=10195 RepID=A0A3M7R4D3_BRAPC|nr:hypothetical protein BpHYR1_054452 [Brachionus plicatilis]
MDMLLKLINGLLNLLDFKGQFFHVAIDSKNQLNFFVDGSFKSIPQILNKFTPDLINLRLHFFRNGKKSSFINS